MIEDIPNKLKNIILNREDLMELGFLEINNQRFLIQWLIKHGFNEYQELCDINEENNEFFYWLSSNSSVNKYSEIPKIFLGIWDCTKMHRRRWPYPENSSLYFIWLEINWDNLNFRLPSFNNLFESKLDFIDILNYYFRSLIWLIRNSLFNGVDKLLGSNLNLYISRKILGWNIQINVVNALVYRELKTRVSQVRFGVAGVFIEPLGVMCVFLLLFRLLRSRPLPIPIYLFLGSGIVLFTMFSDVAIRSSNGMSANEALFFYKPVKPIDTVLARTVVESCLYGIVFIVIIIGTFLIKQEIILNDIALLFLAYLGLIVCAFGLGLFLMVATFIYPSLQQFIPLLMRPLWFISGVFISLRSIPQFIKPFLSWNPIFQAVELARHSFSLDFILDESVSLVYLWQCAFISLFFGFLFYSINEKRLLTR